MCDLILRQEFLRKCKVDVRLFFKERIPRSLKDMVKLTEQHLAAHGGLFWWVKANKPRQEHETPLPSEHPVQRPAQQHTKEQDHVKKQ